MQTIKDLKNGKYLLRTITEPDAEGVRHTKNRTVEAKDWNDAERQYRVFIREVAKETTITKKERDNKKMSVSELLDRYIEDKKLEGRSVTYLDKMKNYRKRIDESFQGRTIADLTVPRIDKFSQNLANATNRHDESRVRKGTDENKKIRNISDDYKSQIQGLLLSAIQWAARKGYMTDKVTHRVTKLKKGEYEQIEIPDIEAVISFIDSLTADDTVKLHYKVFMNLASWCGLRREEIIALRWKNLDFENGTIDVEKAEVKHEGVHRHEKGPKTKSSKRQVIVPPKVLSILTDWKKLYEQKSPDWSNSDASSAIKPDNHVIVDPDDGSLPYPDTFTKWTAKYIKRNAINRVTIHGLRHFYATYLISKGVDIKVVQKLAGHKDIKVTLQIYAAVTKAGYDKAKEVLSSI